MFGSFMVMVREGIEAALVIGIVLVILNRSQRYDLKRPVFWGLGWAILASMVMAMVLNSLPINEEAYGGFFYWASAIFVASMMWWIHRQAKFLRGEIEKKVGQAMAATASRKEAWGLGAFTFFMVFREGAETVMLLSAIQLNTEALLNFLGTILGLVVVVVFCVLFVRGSLKVNLRRFFFVTEWVLGIFIVQLVINGYHEFAESGFVPATQQSMAIVGPVVRHNSLFLLALLLLPLLIWLSKGGRQVENVFGRSDAQRRLITAQIKQERRYRYGAVLTTVVLLTLVGFVYAKESMPKKLPPPESADVEKNSVVIPLAKLEDEKLHRVGVLMDGKMVRFLIMKTSDGKFRTALDACKICGTFGYIQDHHHLLCLNCAAEINSLTLGSGGGCNPIPLESHIEGQTLVISMKDLQQSAHLFAGQSEGVEAVDPVCGMRVKVNEAVAFETYHGKTYYFCRLQCQEAFRKNSAQFVQGK